jgi:hypothetical protein
MNKINLAQKFSLFDKPWQPKIIGELNNSYIKFDYRTQFFSSRLKETGIGNNSFKR